MPVHRRRLEHIDELGFGDDYRIRIEYCSIATPATGLNVDDIVFDETPVSIQPSHVTPRHAKTYPSSQLPVSAHVLKKSIQSIDFNHQPLNSSSNDIHSKSLAHSTQTEFLEPIGKNWPNAIPKSTKKPTVNFSPILRRELDSFTLTAKPSRIPARKTPVVVIVLLLDSNPRNHQRDSGIKAGWSHLLNVGWLSQKCFLRLGVVRETFLVNLTDTRQVP